MSYVDELTPWAVTSKSLSLQSRPCENSRWLNRVRLRYVDRHMKYLHLRSHSPLTPCMFLAAVVFTTTAAADVRTHAAAAFEALEHTLEKHNPNAPDETGPRTTRSTQQSHPATRAKTRHHTARPLSTRTHQRNGPPLTSLSSRRQPAAPNKEYSRTHTPAPVHSPRATSQPKMNTPLPLAGRGSQRLAKAVFAETNRLRRSKGLSHLTHARPLTRAAQSHCDRMIELSFFDHYDNSDERRRTPTMRVRRAGGENPFTSENLITASPLKDISRRRLFVIDRTDELFSLSPHGKPISRHSYASLARSIVDRWFDSPGHRANLLRQTSVQMGVAVSVKTGGLLPMYYVCQVFQNGRPLVH